jgi:hypothetical protein
MTRSEKFAREIALQLAIALAFFMTFQLQLAIPGIPGTDFAALIFIPALVRVLATLYGGPSAAIGLFIGSMLIMLKFAPYEPQMLWRAISSAASAPIAYLLFGLVGLFPSGRSPLRSDASILFLFIASYAVINAGLHLIGLTVAGAPLSQHLPYFLVMVAGDAIVPAVGFGGYFIVKRLIRSSNTV